MNKKLKIDKNPHMIRNNDSYFYKLENGLWITQFGYERIMTFSDPYNDDSAEGINVSYFSIKQLKIVDKIITFYNDRTEKTQDLAFCYIEDAKKFYTDMEIMSDEN